MMTMTRYRMKSVEVEAIQYDGSLLSAQTCATFAGEDVAFGAGTDLRILTSVGIRKVQPGDWIIRDARGECRPCPAEVFRAAYEPSDPEPSGTRG